MQKYKIKRLPNFENSVFEADLYLYQISEAAADSFFEDYSMKIEKLSDFPFMYQEYEYDPYFRSIPLVFDYRLFYHVDEKEKIVVLHKIIRGMRDLKNITVDGD